ncbi:unnamed protein product [Lymnaea stagnalis]|uniref:ZP domain-containing protein n=1 Tax=Lymnaea stagnalis TaxID=6523 RepID=A0AAV2HVW5_LYMST
MRAGAFTGSGVFGDPYILEINLSSGLQAQQPDCGVTQSADSTLNLTMVKQRSCDGTTASDQRYTSSCKIVIPAQNTTTINGQASYSCIAPSTINFNYYRPLPEVVAPADIYATGKRSTCSKSAGVGRGQGLEGSPFETRIQVTNTPTDCGVQNTAPGVYSVVMYIQQYTSVLTRLDEAFLLTCNFTTSSVITIQSLVVTASNYPPTQSPPQRTTTASLSVVSGTGTAGLTSLVVGDQIRLVAQLLDSPAVGLRITSCTASPGPGLLPVIQVLNSKGCSTSPTLVTPFIGQSPTGTVAMTNLFSAFKFDQSNTVYFQCQAFLCYDSDLSCLGNHCTVNARRRREAPLTTVEVLGVAVVVVENVNSTGPRDTKDNSHIVGVSATDQSLSVNTHPPVLPPSSPSTWPLSAIVSVAVLATVLAVSCIGSAGLVLARRRDKMA